MARSFVFPGQGSQIVGMGKALAQAFPAAREVFEEVDDALGQRLSRIMWEGPQDDLNLTSNAQPALLAHSMAAVRVLERDGGVDFADAMFTAGHSLGEYSALCAARALSLGDSARLLRIRGDAMQAAAPVGAGAMAALLGIDVAGAETAIRDVAGDGVLQIANDNAPGQVVISGDRTRVEAVVATSRSLGVKMAKLLPVSAAFHCSLMEPAAARMAAALAEISLAAPITPLVSNISASPVTAPPEIIALLVQQVTGRVRWTESIAYMAEQGVTRFIEVGTGKVLSGLNRRIAPGAECTSIGEPADIEQFLNR